MQKKKKVSKAKSAVKKVALKGTSKATSKAVSRTASKSVPAKSAKTTAKTAVKTAAVKATELKPKIKAKGKSKAIKAAPKPSHTLENPATNVPLTKEEFKNMSVDDQEHYKKWLKLHKQLSVEKPIEYRMSEDFELKAPISHKVHGWGVVMQKRDNYIDVLFEAGLKTLIVNYKP